MPLWNPSNCGELFCAEAHKNPDCVGIERTLTLRWVVLEIEFDRMDGRRSLTAFEFCRLAR
jgi:hypothetical protein